MQKQPHTNPGFKSTIRFTGKERVNQSAGKTLGTYSLFASQGGALSLLCLGLLILLPEQTWAHTGDLFTNEIGKVEGLLTGGYMRLGLLGVCGVTAITGAIQQNAWMFVTGIFAGVFAYFMKDWILSTFSMVI